MPNLKRIDNAYWSGSWRARLWCWRARLWCWLAHRKHWEYLTWGGQGYNHINHCTWCGEDWPEWESKYWC